MLGAESVSTMAMRPAAQLELETNAVTTTGKNARMVPEHTWPEASVEHSSAIALLSFVVEPNYAGWRLDKYLCAKIPRLSRTRVQEIIAKDLTASRPLKPSTLVTAGLAFTLRKKVRTEPDVPAAEATREVFRDEALIVFDKPAGLPIHPTARYHHATFVEQCKVRYGPDFPVHPAHRLDRETSGLLVCARTPLASRRLSDAFARGLVQKEYLAIVEGQPPADSFTVDAAIAEGTALIRIAVRIDEALGRAARTDFEVLRRFAKGSDTFALVRCLPRTGRQHQIRIHLRHAGYPIVGDKMYGPNAEFFDRFSKHALEEEAWLSLRLKRHALHASRVELRHPASGQTVAFDSDLPADLKAFLL